MTGGNDQAGIGRLTAVGRAHAPPVRRRSADGPRAADRAAEGDRISQTQPVGVGAQITTHLIAAREQRVHSGHRCADKPRGVPRRDQVQRLVVRVPVPTDLVRLLETVQIDSVRAQRRHRCQAGSPRTDHAVTGIPVRLDAHRVLLTAGPGCNGAQPIAARSYSVPDLSKPPRVNLASAKADTSTVLAAPVLMISARASPTAGATLWPLPEPATLTNRPA